MPPRPPNESQPLTSWESSELKRKARLYDEKNVETMEEIAHKVEALEKRAAFNEGKSVIITLLGSAIVSLVFHMLSQYLGLHK